MSIRDYFFKIMLHKSIMYLKFSENYNTLQIQFTLEGFGLDLPNHNTTLTPNSFKHLWVIFFEDTFILPFVYQ